MDINKNEILFWKVIRNIYLFKYILNNFFRNQIDTIGSSLRPIYSIKWLIRNDYRNTLKFKLLNDHYLELDCKTNESNIFSFLSPIKNNVKTKEFDELVFFNFYKKFYNSIIPSYKGDGLLNQLISITVNSNNIPAFKVLCKEKYGYNYYLNPKKVDIMMDSYISHSSYNHFKTLNKVRKLLYKHCKSGEFSIKSDNDEIKVWDEISNCFSKEIERQVIGIPKNNFSTNHSHINENHKQFSEGLSQCLIENSFFKCICTYIKLCNFLMIQKGIKPPPYPNHSFYKSFNTIYEFCPISSNFKVGFLYNLCKSISKIKQFYQNYQTIDSSLILTFEELNTLEFNKKQLKQRISIVDPSFKNVQLLLKMFLNFRDLKLNISSPLYYYKYSKQEDYDNFQSIETIEKNINNFNGCEVIALRYGNFDLFKRWYEVMNSYISPKLDLFYCNQLNDSFGKIIKKVPSSTFKDSSNGFHGTSCRLLELLESNDPPLFNNCKDRSKQIEFINNVCNEINNNFNQFKLHPIIFFQLIIQFNDLEFIKITLEQLGGVLKQDTIPQPPSNIPFGFLKDIDQINWGKENNYYNPINIFKRIKSIEIYQFILDNFKFYNFLHDWFLVKDMIYESTKKFNSIPLILNKEIIKNTNSISMFEYCLYKTGSILEKDQIYLFKKPKKQISYDFFNHLQYIIENSTNNHNLYFLIHYIRKFNRINQIKLFEFFNWIDKRGIVSFDTPQLTLHQVLKNGIQSRIEMEDVFKYIVATFNKDNELLNKRFFSPFETLDKFTHKYSRELSRFMAMVIDNKDFNIINLIMLNYFNIKDYSVCDHQNLLFYVKRFIGDHYNIKILYYLLESHNYSFLKYTQQIDHPFFIDLKNSLTINEFNYLYNEK
ncbi:hypothetical protein RB653_008639 [Dictyostelium firmibasis]|uniref:Uncharacterized protein n=1 Tax=Dictyostelium firmibasis TaxID=79012 RepID=A0AAN7TSW3_9MYCE